MCESAHFAWMSARNLRPNTVAMRASVLRRLRAEIGDDPCNATAAQLVTFLRGQPATRAVTLSHLRSYFRWAIEEGLIETDPTARIPRPRLPRRLPRPIPADDLALALNTATTTVRRILALGAYAGLRAAEIAQLHRDDFREGAILLRETKGGGEAMVPCSPVLASHLGILEPGWVFPRRDGRPGHLSRNSVSMLANGHFHALGMLWTLHQARHWFATEVYRATRDLRLTQELLRHASPVTTASYAAIDLRDGASAVALLPVLATQKASRPEGREA